MLSPGDMVVSVRVFAQDGGGETPLLPAQLCTGPRWAGCPQAPEQSPRVARLSVSQRVGSRAGLHLCVCEGRRPLCGVGVLARGWSWGAPALPACQTGPCCRRAAQPVPTSVLRALPVFGSLLGTVTVAVGSLCASPCLSPIILLLTEMNLYSLLCFLGVETEAGGREAAEPSPNPHHPQAQSHASPRVVFFLLSE